MKITELSIEPAQPPVNASTFFPFSDGTIVKMMPREWSVITHGPKPANFDQHILVTVTGDQLAIVKSASIAALLCDAVNFLHRVAQEHQTTIAPDPTQLYDTAATLPPATHDAGNPIPTAGNIVPL